MISPPPQRPGRSPLLHRPLGSYYLLLGSTAMLVGLGLVMVLSASSVQSYSESGSSFTIFQKQALWVLLGLPVLWVGSRLPAAAYRWLAYPLLLGSLVLLGLVLMPGMGRNVYGATRWLDLGPLQMQPSEPAKLALALWGADLFTRKAGLLGQRRHLLVPLVPVTLLFASLVMLEPDLGTTIVLLLVTLGLLWVVGAPGRLLGLLMGAVAGLASLVIAVEPYRMARITSFLHPFADPQAGGYQAIQGLYALASGGWFGVGLGASRQKWSWLPNQYTDYIFAIIGEELGLLGTLVVVLLFGILGYAGIRVARRTPDPFCRLAAAAVTFWLLGQAVVNMGAVAGLLPITGIPLPMVSFGGSALVPTMFAVGMLMSFARAEPGAAAALAARRPGWLRRRVRRTPAVRPVPVSRYARSSPHTTGRAGAHLSSRPTVGRGERMPGPPAAAGRRHR